MTIPGVDATVALSIVAAVGDFTRFRTPDKLVAYLGLNPRVRQSGGQPASHGRITKAGPAHARGMLVEAAWSASKAPGPLRAFYQRVRARRGMQIAVVATARKLAVLCWHLIIKGEDYAFAQPSLVAHKQPQARAARRAARPPGQQGQVRRLLPQGRPCRRTRPRRPGRSGLPHHGRRLAAQPASHRKPQTTKRGGGRGRQQWDATLKPVGATQRGRTPSPSSCSSLGGRPRPPPPDATAVLAAVKVAHATVPRSPCATPQRTG